MAERGNPTPGEEQRLRQRAMRRLALALAVIVAAIVGLGLLDHYTERKPASAPPAPSREPPSIAGLPEPGPVAPDAGAPQAPPAAPAAALPPPPPPSVGDQPAAPSGTATEMPARTLGGSRAAAPAPPAPRPPGSGDAPASAPPLAPPLEARAGFVVQLGLFTTTENAQALQVRLRQQGIPAFLETRVVVGPFRDRAEADAAQRKLKDLGAGGVIVERK